MTQQNSAGTIRVIVVDDDAIVRETLSSILDSEPDIDVIATADNGAEAVALVHERTVDVALMDIQMPVLDGVEATSRIRKTSERTRVLLLTTFDEDTFLDCRRGLRFSAQDDALVGDRGSDPHHPRRRQGSLTRSDEAGPGAIHPRPDPQRRHDR